MQPCFLADPPVVIPFGAKLLHLHQQAELSSDQEEDPHGRLLQREQIVIQLQRLLLPSSRDGLDHVKDLPAQLLRADRFNVRLRDHVLFQSITEQLLQLPVNVFHVRTGLLQKKLQPGLRDHLAFLLHPSQDPALQRGFILFAEFHRAAGLLHRFEQAAPFVRLGFVEKKEGGGRRGLQIVRQRVPALFEPAAVLNEDDSALREKRHGLRQVNNLGRIDILSLEGGNIHGIPFVRHGGLQPVTVLIPQIGLLPVKEVGLTELSCFDVLQKLLHAPFPSASSVSLRACSIRFSEISTPVKCAPYRHKCLKIPPSRFPDLLKKRSGQISRYFA